MKKLLLTAMGLWAACTLSAQFSTASLQATGLTCALCSNAVNKSLQEVPFVESVKSDIKNSSFAIVFKAGMAVEIDALKTAVEDAGFSVGSLKLTGQFPSVKLEKDKHVTVGDSHFHFLNGNGQQFGGEQVITVVDKNFVGEKQFKKLGASSKMSCVQTGKATGACCTKDGISEGARVYHVII